MKKEIDKELLIRYINERCTAEDLLQVQQFLCDPQWQPELEKMLEADFSSMEPAQGADETVLAQWNQEFRNTYIKTPAAGVRQTRWLSYAAACLMVLGIGLYFFNQQGGPARQPEHTAVAMVEKSNPRGIRSKVTLPDSSVVYLGAGSSIRYPERFETKERTLTLSGEAFFEITKNPDRPFVIHTADIQTTVLGTSFKITAFKGDPLSVEVATGKVRISRTQSRNSSTELAVLLPGEGIKWDQGSAKAEAIYTEVSAVKNWARGEMFFKNRSLAQIAAELENWYDAEISFTKAVRQSKRLSLSVDGTLPLSDALEVICNTAHLEYRFNGRGKVMISGSK